MEGDENKDGQTRRKIGIVDRKTRKEQSRERERERERLKMKGEAGPFPTWFMFYTKRGRKGAGVWL